MEAKLIADIDISTSFYMGASGFNENLSSPFACLLSVFISIISGDLLLWQGLCIYTTLKYSIS